MNNPTPRVSIGLPVYNGEQFIEETLDSLLAQTMTDFELIISDNASTDRTQAICEAIAAKDRRIRYNRNRQNLGAAWNYNRVFELSRKFVDSRVGFYPTDVAGGWGRTPPYFKWAAANDVCDARFLSRCVEVLDNHPEVVLAYPKTRLIDENGNTVTMEEDALELNSPDVVTRFSCSLSSMKQCHNPVMGLIRSNVLSQTRLIGNYLASDRCLVAELSLHGRFWEVPEQLFYRRKHRGNVGSSKAHLKFFDPSIKRKIVLPEWRVCQSHFAAIKRTPMPFALKMRLVAAVFRWVVHGRESFLSNLKVAASDLIAN